jgi:hypothetical protein
MVKILELLDQIELGTLSVAEAAEKIRKSGIHSDDTVPCLMDSARKAKWLKIRIIDPESNFNLHLPSLPLRFTGRLAIFLIKMALRYTENPAIQNISHQDIQDCLEILKSLPPIELVSIHEAQGILIEIYTH